MSVSRLSKQSIQTGFPKQQTILDQSTSVASMDALASVTVATNQASVTFTNIPQTYTHLEIRAFTLSSSGNADTGFQIGGDTNSRYYYFCLAGTNAGLAASWSNGTTSNVYFNSYGATVPGIAIAQIPDYTNPNKYKSIKSMYGYGVSGGGRVGIHTGWYNYTTNAVSTVTLFSTANYAPGTSIALYGIK